MVVYACSSLAAEPYTFGPHPRLKHVVPDAHATGAPKPGSPEALRKWAGLIRSAEDLLKDPLVVPTEGGQWVFYYACPKHNCGLTLKDGKHTCPKCGKVYADERTRLAYVSMQHNRVDSIAFTLAKAWHVSRRNEFAKEAYRILGRYAELHPTWQRHDRWGRKGVFAVIGGKRHCQSLSDAVGIIRMAKAYDLVRNWDGIDAAGRAKIESDFFRATVESIYAFYSVYSPKNNHTTWFNAAAANVAAALGDSAMLRKALDGPKGLRSQFGASVTAEGLWYEGTISYHFYALRAVEETVRAAQACGADLTAEPALKKMYLAPLQLAYPNGQLPAFNDGDRAFIKGYRRMYAFAAETWDDPELKQFAETGQVQPMPSAVYKDAGLAYLRRGKGDRAVAAILDYGQHGGHHGHPDKLQVTLYALGREIFLDPGRLTYRCPEHKTWTRQTVAHNTVVIDKQSQAPIAGTLLAFERTEHYDAIAAESAHTYPGVRLRRGLLLFDRMLVDVFHVRADGKVTMDWVLHGLAELVAPKGRESVDGPLHTKAGYQHLEELRKTPPGVAADVEWKLGKGKSVRTLLVSDGPGVFYSGTGIGYKLSDRVPFLMVRRTGKEAVFVCVYDSSGDGSLVRNVSITDHEDAETVIEIGLPEDTWRVSWNTRSDGKRISASRHGK